MAGTEHSPPDTIPTPMRGRKMGSDFPNLIVQESNHLSEPRETGLRCLRTGALFNVNSRGRNSQVKSKNKHFQVSQILQQSQSASEGSALGQGRQAEPGVCPVVTQGWPANTSGVGLGCTSGT
jgi:hypothetical protein